MFFPLFGFLQFMCGSKVLKYHSNVWTPIQQMMDSQVMQNYLSCIDELIKKNQPYQPVHEVVLGEHYLCPNPKNKFLQSI